VVVVRGIARAQQADVPPAARTEGAGPATLQNYRLSLLREEALKRLDAKGITKLVQIEQQLRKVSVGTDAHIAELRRLLGQLEQRYGLTAPE